MSNSAATYSRTSTNNDAKFLLIGVLIAMIAYGVALFLAGAYVHSFIQLEAHSQANRDRSTCTPEKRSRYFFLFYTIIMFCLSTFACIAGTLRAYHAVFPPSTKGAFPLIGDAVGIVAASWCADVLMFWRCLEIYKKASSLWRALLIALLSTLYAATIATGLAFILTCQSITGGVMVSFAATSTILNATITTLIVARIWCQQKYIEGALGRGFTATYTRLIHLFVESAALIVVFNLGHVILSQYSNHKYILAHSLLAHVYVISTLLIIYRIAGSFQRFSPGATVILDTELRLSSSFNTRTDNLSMFDDEARSVEKAGQLGNATANIHSQHGDIP